MNQIDFHIMIAQSYKRKYEVKNLPSISHNDYFQQCPFRSWHNAKLPSIS